MTARLSIPSRPWVNVLLFALTVLSTFFVGLTHAVSFLYAGDAGLDQAGLAAALLGDPRVVTLGGIYAAVLLIILLGHEMGHYLTCRRYGILASLPYFIPAPTLIGTLGAYIRIKSPITLKRQLLDIGVAGPLTGFLLSLPALTVGLALSRIVPALPPEETLEFGEPLLLKAIAALVLADVPPGYDVLFHPVGFAGWVGLLVTAFNLFPLGQLDGGHVAYAVAGRRSGPIARILLGAFVVLGVFFWVGWLVWALIILLMGLKHPRILDEEAALSPSRKILGICALAVFVLSFAPAPIKGFSAIGLLRQWGL